jgi:hypothetical protein
MITGPLTARGAHRIPPKRLRRPTQQDHPWRNSSVGAVVPEHIGFSISGAPLLGIAFEKVFASHLARRPATGRSAEIEQPPAAVLPLLPSGRGCLANCGPRQRTARLSIGSHGGKRRHALQHRANINRNDVVSIDTPRPWPYEVPSDRGIIPVIWHQSMRLALPVRRPPKDKSANGLKVPLATNCPHGLPIRRRPRRSRPKTARPTRLSPIIIPRRRYLRLRSPSA